MSHQEPPENNERSENYWINPLWSTGNLSASSHRIPRPVPPQNLSAQDQGNPGSQYQAFYFDVNSCEACLSGGHPHFRDCSLAWAPLLDFYTRAPLPCINCGSNLHSIFGCGAPLRGAIIVWHFSGFPSSQGVIELARDIRVGFYNITAEDWSQLSRP
jgi:hypothetical protein